MKKLPLTLFTLLALFLLVACGGSTTTNEPMAENAAAAHNSALPNSENETMMADDTSNQAMNNESAMPDETMADEAVTDETITDETMADTMDSPAWQQIALTDVRTGETFTLADFAGKTVFVEPMATWCTNCRRQLTNVSSARAQLDDSVVFVALSVETNISNDDLKQYTESTGFDWVFAVATPDLLRELATLYGQTITNPPSTPHFIIRPDGSTTDLVTGIEGVEAIVSQIQDAQG
jgi:thiol-disulfide isomerase/thioredoxin